MLLCNRNNIDDTVPKLCKSVNLSIEDARCVISAVFLFLSSFAQNVFSFLDPTQHKDSFKHFIHFTASVFLI